MSMGVNVGFMHVGFHFGGYGGYGGGWFGPPYYRPPYYRPPYYGGGGGYYGNRRPIHIGNNNITINNNHNNIYNKRKGVSTRDVNRGGAVSNNRNPNSRPAARPSTGANNIFADKSGNVFQKDNKGNWNQRGDGNKSWKPAPSGNTGNMTRESQLRDRSNNRTNNYQRQQRQPAARPMPVPKRGGGAGAGGGGASKLRRR